jgi:hypothetical protein
MRISAMAILMQASMKRLPPPASGLPSDESSGASLNAGPVSPLQQSMSSSRHEASSSPPENAAQAPRAKQQTSSRRGRHGCPTCGIRLQ